MKNKENKKILIYGCGLIGSSLAFLLNDQEIYLKGDFSSEKKFLNEGYIIYKLSNIDKIFKIKVNFIDFEKEFFIPDLIIASFKLDAIYRWNEFIKKIDLKLQKKNPKGKIDINVLFIQNGYGWENLLENNFLNINLNVLRGIVLYNVSKYDDAIIQTSKGELILEDKNILKNIFNTNNKNKLIDEKNINDVNNTNKKNNVVCKIDKYISVKFVKNINDYIINKLVLNISNGILTYLKMNFYNAIIDKDVAYILMMTFFIALNILKIKKVKIIHFKNLNPEDLIIFIYIYHNFSYKVFLFYKSKKLQDNYVTKFKDNIKLIYFGIIFFIKKVKFFLKIFILFFNENSNNNENLNKNKFKKFFFLINKKNLLNLYLNSLPKGFNSLYNSIFNQNEKKIEVNEFKYIIFYFLKSIEEINLKIYNKTKNLKILRNKIKTFEKYLLFLDKEIGNLILLKEKNYMDKNNKFFEYKKKIIKFIKLL